MSYATFSGSQPKRLARAGLLVLAVSKTPRKTMEGGSEPQKIRKWCHFYFKSGCERGHFCTYAHTWESMGKIIPDRKPMEATSRMVLCKLFKTGGGALLIALSRTAQRSWPCLRQNHAAVQSNRQRI